LSASRRRKDNSHREKVRQFREELQHGMSPDLRRRRAIIAFSLIGMGSMAFVSAFQTGLIKHLPDPPLNRFQSDEVNSSETAYHWGVPDGTVSLAGHATNIVLAAYGGPRRAIDLPWLALMACTKAAAEAAVAVRYLFYEMPIVQKKWCGYCIVDALAHMGTFVTTLPEAWNAMTRRSELATRKR
jgi:uncharacterized membrane protein